LFPQFLSTSVIITGKTGVLMQGFSTAYTCHSSNKLLVRPLASLKHQPFLQGQNHAQVIRLSGENVIREIDAEVLDGIGRSVFSTGILCPRTITIVPPPGRRHLSRPFSSAA
jgi:hypothetical protein